MAYTPPVPTWRCAICCRDLDTVTRWRRAKGPPVSG
jgi:hypothetical protein